MTYHLWFDVFYTYGHVVHIKTFFLCSLFPDQGHFLKAELKSEFGHSGWVRSRGGLGHFFHCKGFRWQSGACQRENLHSVRRRVAISVINNGWYPGPSCLFPSPSTWREAAARSSRLTWKASGCWRAGWRRWDSPDGSSHKQSLQEGKENYASRMHLWEIDTCGAGRNALILKFFCNLKRHEKWYRPLTNQHSSANAASVPNQKHIPAIVLSESRCKHD